MTTLQNNLNQHIIIFQGDLYIQKGWFNNWKPRYCTLSTSRKLNFYYHREQINNIKPILIIDLSTIISIHENVQSPQSQPPSSPRSFSASLTPTPTPSSRSASTTSASEFPSFNYSSSPNLSNNKFSFCLETTTSDKRHIFGCDDEDVMDQWMKHLTVYIFGDIIHSEYMIKQGYNLKNWKKRWFTLSSHWRELRYYENKNVSRETYKGKIDLRKVNVLRFGDKINYGYEYTMELILGRFMLDILCLFQNKHSIFVKWNNFCVSKKQTILWLYTYMMHFEGDM